MTADLSSGSMLGSRSRKNASFVLEARIAHMQPQHKAVKLRFGQRICAVMLRRILRRDDHERQRQPARNALDRHLFFGHRFEQGGLCFWRRSVYLVGQNDVRKYRPGLPFKIAALLIDRSKAR